MSEQPLTIPSTPIVELYGERQLGPRARRDLAYAPHRTSVSRVPDTRQRWSPPVGHRRVTQP